MLNIEVGDKIQLLQMLDPHPVPTGATGRVTDISSLHATMPFGVIQRVAVNWDPPLGNCNVMLLVPPDIVRVIND